MTTAKNTVQTSATAKEPNKAVSSYAVKNQTLAIQAMVQNAGKFLAPVWPLETFIACNPLQGFESMRFEEALAHGQVFQARTVHHDGLLAVNTQLIKWCSSFFDVGQSSIEMPHREEGFYPSFLKLAVFDRQLHQNKSEAKAFLIDLPESAEEAIVLCLQDLGIPEIKREAFITQTLMYLPGWGGFVKWKTDWQNISAEEQRSITLADFIAVRLVMTCLLWPEAAKAAVTTDGLRVQSMMTTIKTNEQRYKTRLLGELLAYPHMLAPKPRTDAQLVFCIDVRSEPFRRALEAEGNYETFGFAGFFGIPVRVHEFESKKAKDCCPVLLKPRYDVREVPVAANDMMLDRYYQGKAMVDAGQRLFNQLKHNISTPFALVESTGLWYGAGMLLKTIAPDLTHKTSRWLKNRVMPSLSTQAAFEPSARDATFGMSLKEQIAYAETVLRLIGLTQGFGKLVVFCGHGSATENNPYASALDCGACGGNHGGMNAKLLAAILNKSDVKQGLEEVGIHIPLDTQFLGGLHNTTTDTVTLYTDAAPKPVYPQLIRQLTQNLESARLAANKKRAPKLGSTNPEKDITHRSQDWSETRPEWGLARNAAFIVAPRTMTQAIDLDGRCFLHSYRWEQDTDGSLLEIILTAPMVVAEWINTQYLFSTVDNVAFGSGSKITHNVTGTMGVMQGNGSDLMHGLPLQSVMSDDQNAYHEPQRLLTVVHAPKDRVHAIIEKQTVLKTLFFNEWVHLVVIDPTDEQAWQLSTSGEWVLFNHKE